MAVFTVLHFRVHDTCLVSTKLVLEGLAGTLSFYARVGPGFFLNIFMVFILVLVKKNEIKQRDPFR